MLSSSLGMQPGAWRFNYIQHATLLFELDRDWKHADVQTIPNPLVMIGYQFIYR